MRGEFRHNDLAVEVENRLASAPGNDDDMAMDCQPASHFFSCPIHAAAAAALAVATLLNAIRPLSAAETQSPRIVLNWDADWKFSKGDFAAAMAPGFDDSRWRRLSVPHDWSNEEPFRPDYASGTGYAAGGVGWYRKHFPLDSGWTNWSVAVEFDGIYAYSEVWVNGQ